MKCIRESLFFLAIFEMGVSQKVTTALEIFEIIEVNRHYECPVLTSPVKIAIIMYISGIYQWWEDEEEDICSYWMILRKGELIGDEKRKH
jgi:hypothetical protein